MTFPLDGFDVIHASPMWLGFTAQAFRTETGRGHDTVTPIYARLVASGKPWVCESGSHGPLRDAALFCGPAFGLRVIRHMWFASSEVLLTPGCAHEWGGCARGLYVPLRGAYHKDRAPEKRPPTQRRVYAEAAGISWMAGRAADLAVPPAYTEFIGTQLLRALERAA
jgi:DNA (cytosine-5)-methyltransferase 1